MIGICIEGIIGSGKSTLCDRLSDEFSLNVVEEPVDDNPYLDRFYQNQRRWAFQMQMWLVARRCMLQVDAQSRSGPGYVTDRSVMGDRVFARMHHEAGNISDDLWPVYTDFFSVMTKLVQPPHLMVFLNVSPQVAMERIQERARGAETEGVTMEYLRRLREGYLRMIDEVSSGGNEWGSNVAVLQFDGYKDIDATVRAIHVHMRGSIKQDIVPEASSSAVKADPAEPAEHVEQQA